VFRRCEVFADGLLERRGACFGLQNQKRMSEVKYGSFFDASFFRRQDTLQLNSMFILGQVRPKSQRVHPYRPMQVDQWPLNA